MDIRDILRMAAEMADASNKAKEQSEKRRDAIIEAVRGGADREEIRKLLDEHYKKVDESLDIGTKKKAMKEVMKDSDTATDSAFTQAITALKQANEKMDEFNKEIQLDFLCDMSEPEVGTHELFALLGFVQASCDYSEFMFRCIYETLTGRIEKLRKENEEIVRKYKRAVDNLDAVLKEREEEGKNEKGQKGKTIPEMLKGIHDGLISMSGDANIPRCFGTYDDNENVCLFCEYEKRCKDRAALNE